MHCLEYATFDDAYHDLVEYVKHWGEPYAPRGMRCTEVRPCAFTVTQPRRALYTGKSRKLNYRFYVLETLSYVAGWGGRRHAELLCAANPNMRSWVNEKTGAFDWPYGPQLVKSLPDVVDRLRRDRESRREVCAIWSPGLQHSVRDTPCTISITMYVNRTRLNRIDDDRGDRFYDALSCTVHMRSNDLNWGTPYDVAAFATILCLAADCAGLDVGFYNHVADSLHVYEATPPALQEPAGESWFPSDGLTVPLITRGTDFETVMSTAHQFLEAVYGHVVGLGRNWDELEAWRDDPSFWGWCAKLVRDRRP